MQIRGRLFPERKRALTAPVLNFQQKICVKKAESRTRTGDLLITNQLLYQLSYPGIERKEKIHRFRGKVNTG
jgi:hypothetical protein